jgi:preprotein translocase subunit SecG
MSILSIVLLVFFVVVAVLLILIVLVQNEEGEGLGGVFAGGSSSAFGSRSGNVLTRITTVLGAIFLVLSLGLALTNRIPGVSGVEAAGQMLINESQGQNWVERELDALEGNAQEAEEPSNPPEFEAADLFRVPDPDLPLQDPDGEQ